MSAVRRIRRAAHVTTRPAVVAPRLETLEELERCIPNCIACPRLVRWREEVARVKRRAFRDWTYWARPVPGWGDPRARLAIVGLAPAAHGGNRTGRVFTGDRSGDFLYAALHRAGLASQPRSESRDDGLVLRGAWVTLSVRCAPPGNAPRPDELVRCSPWLARELELLRPRVVLALGAIAWAGVLRVFRSWGVAVPRPAPRFIHGAEVSLPGAPWLIGAYHVSQQNTQTGRLTPAMFDAVLGRAIELTR
ncbi:MAG: uracil-DNA glycosylase [Myxococcaceae bacterium]|nr:MAG: uracil-DNA glycosylase [Myxococcaceae bacterium]